MKFTVATLAGMLLFWTCAGLAAATVTVDKPSPPPCCVDGLCYPKTNTWGYYPSQWRRWPGDELRPTAVEPTPAERTPDIAPFETPRPQEEDRRAPPPTKPVQPPTAAPIPPPPTTTPPAAAPQGGSPAETPQEKRQPAAPRMPWDLPQSQPTGELDRPPDLPFGTAESHSGPVLQPAVVPSRPKLRMPGEMSRRAATNDAPPSLPLAWDRFAR